MRRSSVVLVAVLAFAPAIPAAAAPPSLVGQPAPEIGTDARTISTMRVEVALKPGKEKKSGPAGYSNNLKEHEGRVVLLLFFDSSDESKKALARTARLCRSHEEKDPPIGQFVFEPLAGISGAIANCWLATEIAAALVRSPDSVAMISRNAVFPLANETKYSDNGIPDDDVCSSAPEAPGMPVTANVAFPA